MIQVDYMTYHQYKEQLWWLQKQPDKYAAEIVELQLALTEYEQTKQAK